MTENQTTINNYYGVTPPAKQLRTNRGLLKMILLSAITLGIYGLVVMCHISTEMNLICTKYDGKKTMHYLLLMLIFSWLTLGIAPVVWYHRLSNRIGDNLRSRGVSTSFGAGTFWGWCILGSLIVVGPFIYTRKLLKNMNSLCANYNARG